MTKEDIIREVDSRLVWCSQAVEDGAVLNKIQKLQNDVQYFSYTQLGMLLDALEEFNQDKPETISILLDVTGNIGKK
ncbi:MAG: hypothetical protein ACYDIA_02260 [Candidatus Humimicrobiaceae bacterium]